MRRTTPWYGPALAVMLLVPCSAAHGTEGKVSTANVPKPVLETIHTRFKGAQIKSVATELDKGAKVWELGLDVEHRNVDVIVRPAGDIVLFEREIPRTDLPAAVLKTLDTRYPRATYRICEEVIKVRNKQEKLAFYEALLQTAGKQWLGIQISSQGKILVEEKKKSGTLD